MIKRKNDKGEEPMNYRKCMVLLTTVLLVSVLLVPVLLVGYVLWNQHATVVTGEKKLFDKLCLKRTVAEESKDYAAAVKSLLEALDLLEKQSVSDPDKGKLAIAYEALCSACLHLKNDKEAEQYGLMALALKKDVYWEWHFELFNTECLLGTIYTRLNKRDAALQHYSHARRIIAEKPDGVEPFRLSFVAVAAIAAPQLDAQGRMLAQLRAVTLNKIHTIFRIALLNGHDSMILGAWGCGQFKNPPDQIAQLFHIVMNESEFYHKFRKIIFAIKDNHYARKSHNPKGNLYPFVKEFASERIAKIKATNYSNQS